MATAPGERALAPVALSKALADLPPLEVPPGDQTLDVLVRSDRGEPVPGVEIRLLPAVPKSLRWPDGTTWEQQCQAPLAVQVMYFMNAVRWQTEGRRVATTDGEGRCRFERTHDVEHTLTAELQGWNIKPPRAGSSSFRPGALAEFTATPLSGLLLDLRGPDGIAPERATVVFKTGRAEWTRRWTAASPLVEVPPDTYELEVKAGEAEELRSEPRSVTVGRGEGGTTLRVDLVERPTLRLRITFDPTEKVGLLRVAWSRLPEGVPVDANVLASVRRPEMLHQRVGSTFQHVEHGLEAGRYVLGVYRGYAKTPALVQGMTVGPGLTDFEITVPLPQRSEYAILRVRGPDGKALAPQAFRTRFTTKGQSGSSSGVPYVERPDGEYWVFHQPVDGTPEGGRYTITVDHRDLGSRVVTYEAGDEVDEEVRFEEPAFVDLSLPGLARSGLGERARVWLGNPDAGRGDARLGRTAVGDGPVRFTHLQPGLHQVRLLIAFGKDDTLAVVAGEVDVRSGEQALRIDMPELHDVAFEGLAPPASLVWIADEGRERYSISVGPLAGGSAKLTSLPAGRYELRSGGKTVPFTLPGTSLVRVE
ncbi:MAG: hypothetical protein R3F05_20115 [Planctomycetota bacterium]